MIRKKDAEVIFANAEAENMTGEGYAWIVTEQVGWYGFGDDHDGDDVHDDHDHDDYDGWLDGWMVGYGYDDHWEIVNFFASLPLRHPQENVAKLLTFSLRGGG